MIVEKEIHIHMAHRIPNNEGKCKNVHGHSYLIQVGVEGRTIKTEGVSDEGMVIDFSILKGLMKEEIDTPFDHALMIYNKDEFIDIFKQLQEKGQHIHFVPFVPTAENMAKYFFERLEKSLQELDITKIAYVKVWETSTSMAIYKKD